MSQGDYFIMMGVGGGFLILGLIGILWGRHEAKSYFDAMAERSDLREFMAHWPERPQLGALRIGGWIAIAVGFLLLIVGIVLWLLARTPA
jgi:hypothetical protein